MSDDRLGLTGLSPRVRGSRERFLARSRPQGSIPACAGEPHTVMTQSGTAEVYPRVCGGASPTCLWGRAEEGLSPRVRGSPSHDRPS